MYGNNKKRILKKSKIYCKRTRIVRIEKMSRINLEDLKAFAKFIKDL